MNSNSRWMSATIVIVVASLTIGGLEPAVFAAPVPDAAPVEERAQEAPKALPNRPTIVTTSVPPKTAVAQAIQNQTQRPASPSLRPNYVPPARQSTGKSKKWIWILAAAAGAAVTVGVLATRDDDEPEATITLGDPSVGGPQ